MSDPWYDSNKFKTLRLLNNLCGDMEQLTQRIDDVLSVLDSQFEIGAGSLSDKRCILDRQLKIVKLESANLSRVSRSVAEALERIGRRDEGKEDGGISHQNAGE